MMFSLDLESIIEELEVNWKGNPRSQYNSTGFTNRRWVGENYMMCCPFHNETKPSFGVSDSYPYYYHCFACGEKGTIINLVSHAKGISYQESKRLLKYKLSNVDGIDLSFLEEDEEEDSEDEWDDVDEELSLEEELEIYRKQFTPQYLWTRGISTFTADKYEVGVEEETNSIVFPVRKLNGELDYFIKRRRDTKYYHIGKGANKLANLYGLNYLKGRTNKVFITEGTIDVLSCYEMRLPGVAVIGKYLSREHLPTLHQGGIEEVVLFLDNDKWGTVGTLNALEVLRHSDFKVSVVKYPCNRWGIDTVNQEEITLGDPNDILRAGATNYEIISDVEYLFDVSCSKYYREVKRYVRKN